VAAWDSIINSSLQVLGTHLQTSDFQNLQSQGPILHKESLFAPLSLNRDTAMVAHPIVLFLWKTLTATDFGKCLEAGYP
jgi:hypothetical protein